MSWSKRIHVSLYSGYGNFNLLYICFCKFMLSFSVDKYLHYRAMLKVCCMRMMDIPSAIWTEISSVCVNSLCSLADSLAGNVCMFLLYTVHHTKPISDNCSKFWALSYVSVVYIICSCADEEGTFVSGSKLESVVILGQTSVKRKPTLKTSETYFHLCACYKNSL